MYVFNTDHNSSVVIVVEACFGRREEAGQERIKLGGVGCVTMGWYNDHVGVAVNKSRRYVQCRRGLFMTLVTTTRTAVATLPPTPVRRRGHSLIELQTTQLPFPFRPPGRCHCLCPVYFILPSVVVFCLARFPLITKQMKNCINDCQSRSVNS